MARITIPRVLVPHPHVRTDSTVLAGSPHVSGSRVPVRRLWAWHKGGVSVETLFRRYPHLGPGAILDALAFAYDNPEVMQADISREQEMLHKRGIKPTGRAPSEQLPLPFDDRSAKR